jgi:hypothetical protein
MMASSSRAAGLSAQILWIDATANAETLNSDARVQAVVDRCKAAHINGIVVDVKPLSGEVLYDSRYAPRMKEWKGVYYPLEFDVLKAFIERGKAAGIPVYASVNTFSEGHKSFKVGPAYQHKDWQTISYETVSYVEGPADDDSRQLIALQNEAPAKNEMAAFTPASGPGRKARPDEFYAAYGPDNKISLLADGETVGDLTVPIPAGGGLLAGRGDARDWMIRHLRIDQPVRFVGESRFLPAEESRSDKYAVFVNPILPEVRRRALDVVREIARNYPVQGIFLDRMRYPNLHADFSDASRSAFEKWRGKAVERWPEEIVAFPARPGSPPVRGPLFNEWLEWRSGVIRDFLKDARREIRKARRGTQVGVYVGSWYSVYYDVGVNWGSPAFPNRYDWMTPTYAQTGYAPLLDLICSGTYYPTAWKSQAAAAGVPPSATVEGSAEESLAAVRDETVLYGSLYLVQYQNNPEAFRQAIRASLATTGGVMIFDLSYLESYDWWKILEEELPAGKTEPNLVPGFAESIRKARHAADAALRPSDTGEILVAPADHPAL